MKLSEYLALCESSMEVTVWDDVYDMETYFYPGPIRDLFDKATNLIARCVDIIEVSENGVTVNFWDVIETSRQALIDADFYPEDSSTEYLMQDVDAILAGNLSEENTYKWATIIYNAVTTKANNMYGVFNCYREDQSRDKIFTSANYRECLIFIKGYLSGADGKCNLIIKDEKGKIKFRQGFHPEEALNE